MYGAHGRPPLVGPPALHAYSQVSGPRWLVSSGPRMPAREEWQGEGQHDPGY